MRLIIVFNDDFTVIKRLARGRADGIVIIAVVIFTHADIGQNVIDIGDGDRISVDIAANNIADLMQRLRVDMAEQRQRFIGNIER